MPTLFACRRRVFSYLRGRGIDPEIINHCIKHGLLYESAQHHNCVFVGFAGDRPAYAMQRGTLQDKRFVGEVVGSDKRYSFAVPMTPGDSPTLCVFESAIDALSYLTLLKQRALQFLSCVLLLHCRWEVSGRKIGSCHRRFRGI